jgi:hypothetical protein
MSEIKLYPKVENKAIDCDQAIAEIVEVLGETSGEFIAKVYSQVVVADATYNGDADLIEISPLNED